jgi:hypothetical protein
MTKGGSGSHWDGCEESHHDCAIAKLRQTENELSETRAQLELARDGWNAVLKLNEELRADIIFLRSGEELRAQNEELIVARNARDEAEERSASLATWQCPYTDGKTGLYWNDHGHQRCAMEERLSKFRDLLHLATGVWYMKDDDVHKVGALEDIQRALRTL